MREIRIGVCVHPILGITWSGVFRGAIFLGGKTWTDLGVGAKIRGNDRGLAGLEMVFGVRSGFGGGVSFTSKFSVRFGEASAKANPKPHFRTNSLPLATLNIFQGTLLFKHMKHCYFWG